MITKGHITKSKVTWALIFQCWIISVKVAHNKITMLLSPGDYIGKDYAG